MDSIWQTLLTALLLGGVFTVAAVILHLRDRRLGRTSSRTIRTDLKILRKKAVEGVEIVASLVGALFNFLVGVVLLLLALYAAIWIIKRMWEAA